MNCPSSLFSNKKLLRLTQNCCNIEKKEITSQAFFCMRKRVMCFLNNPVLLSVITNKFGENRQHQLKALT